MNNTAEDDSPLFLTAGHCVENNTEASTVVVYWNFRQHPCNQFFGGSLSQNQSGSTLGRLQSARRSSRYGFHTARTRRIARSRIDVYYMGWDARERSRRNRASASTIPAGMRNLLALISSRQPSRLDLVTVRQSRKIPGGVADWDDRHHGRRILRFLLVGCFQRRCVGNLSGGYAACGNDDADWYGRLCEPVVRRRDSRKPNSRVA